MDKRTMDDADKTDLEQLKEGSEQLARDKKERDNVRQQAMEHNEELQETEENNEGNVVTLTKFNNLPFKRIADGIVLLSGAYGFYYGYKNKDSLLLKNL